MTKSFDERNAPKSRRVCEAMAAQAETGKRRLTERERAILAMWPRFEDGEPVMLGDKFEDNEGHECLASVVYLDIDGLSLVDSEGFPNLYRKGKRVKRHAPKVLDADGVEIKVGDSMYVANDGDGPYIVCDIDENIDRIELFWHENRNEKLFIAANRLTHTRPDSWERLEEDAELNDETGIVGGNLDLIRRAKALAEAEVGR